MFVFQIQKHSANLSNIQDGVTQVLMSPMRHISLEQFIASVNLTANLFRDQAPSMMDKGKITHLSFRNIGGRQELVASREVSDLYSKFYTAIVGEEKYINGLADGMGKMTKVIGYLKGKGILPKDMKELSKLGPEKFAEILRQAQESLNDPEALKEINRQQIPNMGAFVESVKGAVCSTSIKAAVCAANVASGKGELDLTISGGDNGWFTMSISGVMGDASLTDAIQEAMLQNFEKILGKPLSPESAQAVRSIFDLSIESVSGLDATQKQELLGTAFTKEFIMQEMVVVASKLAKIYAAYLDSKQNEGGSQTNSFLIPPNNSIFMQGQVLERQEDDRKRDVRKKSKKISDENKGKAA